jgi:threonine dehydrogenase-like Zn-dependent dehydrogenase
VSTVYNKDHVVSPSVYCGVCVYCLQLRSSGFISSVLWGLYLLFTIKITWFHLQCFVGFVSTVYNKDHVVSPSVYCGVCVYCLQLRSSGFTSSVLWGLYLLFTIKITWFHLQCFVRFVSAVYNKDHLVSPPVFYGVCVFCLQ